MACKKSRPKCQESFTSDVVRSALRESHTAGELDEDIERVKASEDPREPFFRVGGSDVQSSRSAIARYKVLLRRLLTAAPQGIVHKLRVREGLRKYSKHDMGNILGKPGDRVRIEGYNLVYMINCIKETRKNSTSGHRLPKFMKDLVDLMLDDEDGAAAAGSDSEGSSCVAVVAVPESAHARGAKRWQATLTQKKEEGSRQAGSKAARRTLVRIPTSDAETPSIAIGNNEADQPENNDADDDQSQTAQYKSAEGNNMFYMLIFTISVSTYFIYIYIYIYTYILDP